MMARVRLFAIARERAGQSSVEVVLPESPTVLDLRAAMGRAFPGLLPLLPSIRFSVNADYAEDSTPIPPGADLAAIPPVSGGSETEP